MFNTGGFGSIPDVVKNLLIINVIMFVATWIFGNELIGTLGLYYFDSPHFKPFQLVSHMFMHGGMFHIFFNMFALWIFGSALEQVWGPKRFLIFYFVTGLGAAVLQEAFYAFEVYQVIGSISIDNITQELSPGELDKLRVIYSTPTVGASGAVFGLLLGFGMLFPNTKLMLIFLPVPIKAKYFVILYGALELILGITNLPGDNIAHFAHLGGMLFGFILIQIWKKDRSNFY